VWHHFKQQRGQQHTQSGSLFTRSISSVRNALYVSAARTAVPEPTATILAVVILSSCWMCSLSRVQPRVKPAHALLPLCLHSRRRRGLHTDSPLPHAQCMHTIPSGCHRSVVFEGHADGRCTRWRPYAGRAPSKGQGAAARLPENAGSEAAPRGGSSGAQTLQLASGGDGRVRGTHDGPERLRRLSAWHPPAMPHVGDASRPLFRLGSVHTRCTPFRPIVL